MKGQIVRTFTADGLLLEGLCAEPQGPSLGVAVIHFHGFAGNFYAHPFVVELGDTVTTRGCVFLTGNNRGHDVVVEVYRKSPNGGSYVTLGSAHEAFEDAVFDLRAWIDWICALGNKAVVLSGHSAGAMKVAYYAATQNDPRLLGLILLAPPDPLGMINTYFAHRCADDRQLAERLVVSGESHALMPEGAAPYPISAWTYLSYLGNNSRAAVFNFHNPNDPFPVLAAIREPILAIIGSEDRHCVVEPTVCMAMLEEKARSAHTCHTVVIPGTGHHFNGKEDQLATVVGRWLDEQILSDERSRE